MVKNFIDKIIIDISYMDIVFFLFIDVFDLLNVF